MKNRLDYPPKRLTNGHSNEVLSLVKNGPPKGGVQTKTGYILSGIRRCGSRRV